MIIIGDIGGTNARLSLYNGKSIDADSFIKYKTQNFDSFDTILADFIATQKIKPEYLILALPGAIHSDGTIHTTNTPKTWNLRKEHFLKTFPSLKKVELYNDFEAQAFGILKTNPADFINLDSKNTALYGNKIIIGPGTGLGVCALKYIKNSWITLPSESGHIPIGFEKNPDSLNFKVIEYFLNHNPDSRPITYERLVSGTGIKAVYNAILALNGKKMLENPHSKEIVEWASKGQKEAIETIHLFFMHLAYLCSALALTHIPEGGIYLVGNVLTDKNLQSLFNKNEFINYFEYNKVKESMFKDFPIKLATHSNIAYLGLEYLAEKITTE